MGKQLALAAAKERIRRLNAENDELREKVIKLTDALTEVADLDSAREGLREHIRDMLNEDEGS